MVAINKFGFNGRKEAFPQLVKALDIPNSSKDVKNLKTKLEQIAAQYFNKRVAPKDQPDAQARIGKCLEHQFPLLFGMQDEKEKKKRLYIAFRAISRFHCNQTKIYRPRHQQRTSVKKSVEQRQPKWAGKSYRFVYESGKKATVAPTVLKPGLELVSGGSAMDEYRDILISEGKKHPADIANIIDDDAKANPVAPDNKSKKILQP